MRSAGHAVAVCLVLLAGCHVRLVSQYDPEFVRQATATQIDIDTLLQTLRNPPPGVDTSYEASKAAYNKIDVDLDTLLTQAQAHSNNQATINQVKALTSTVAGLEQIHRSSGHLTNFELDEEQGAIREQVSSIIRTENAKQLAQ